MRAICHSRKAAPTAGARRLSAARTSTRRRSRTATSSSDFAIDLIEGTPRQVDRLLDIIEVVNAAIPVDGRGVLRLWVEPFFFGAMNARAVWLSPDDIIIDPHALDAAAFAHEYGHFVDCRRRMREEWKSLVRHLPEYTAWKSDCYLIHPGEMVARFFQQVVDARSLKSNERYSDESFHRLLPQFMEMVR